MNMNITPEKFLRRCLIVVAVLGSAATHAEICGLMEVQENKSTAITVKQNVCPGNRYIARGSTITMLPGSRLWLKSNPSVSREFPFQLICQNMSDRSMDAKIADLFPPWLVPDKAGLCTGWIDNKLSCQNAARNRSIFFCALSSGSGAENQRESTANTLSVKIRSLSETTHAGRDKDRETRQGNDKEAVMEEMKLCKTVNNIVKTNHFTWRIEPAGTNYRVDIIDSTTQNGAYFECVKSVLEYFPYSHYREPVTFSVRL